MTTALTYTNEDLENTLSSYVKYEVLEAHHSVMGRDKQSNYCTEKLNSIFSSLVVVLGGQDAAFNKINEYSENNYSRIEAEVL